MHKCEQKLIMDSGLITLLLILLLRKHAYAYLCMESIQLFITEMHSQASTPTFEAGTRYFIFLV